MRYIIFLLLLISFKTSLYADPVLSKRLIAVSDKDTLVNVWVFFKDRPSGSIAAEVSPRALERRKRAGFRFDESSRPVERRYIKEIEARGAKLRHQFPWENAASFTLHASAFKEVASLPFVKFMKPVNVYIRKDIKSVGLAKSHYDGSYGWHLEMVNVRLAHEYLRAKNMGNPGSGVLLAFFDSGFRFDHKAYQYAKGNGLIIVERDFVDGGSSVSDPSVTLTSNSGYDSHGTQTLSLVAGYDPGEFMGIGWGANFAAARTEDYKVESWVEEDNWARAVVWADSIGADIISSSLGYRYGFDDDINDPDFPYDYPFEYNNDGEYDYPYEYMDGKTTIVSRAAAGAAARGIIVVNSAGNSGNNITGRLSAPADVDEVISVGAVDENRSIAHFSSSGPTFDGRLKPDLCAPGFSVPMPHVYCPNRASYRTNSGTSFSAPIVAGISALILQANREKGLHIDAAGVKEKLYASCGFAHGQTEIDYKHGRGIPNTLLAIMDNDEIFIKVTDKAGNGLHGAQIVNSYLAYTTNESGVIVAKLSSAELPLSMRVLFRGEEIDSIKVNSLPFAQSLALNVDGQKVLPSVVKKDNILKGRYYFHPPQNSKALAAVTIVSLNGKILRNEKLPIRPDGSVDFLWDYKINGKRAVPGVYFLTMRHNGETIRHKFLIHR